VTAAVNQDMVKPGAAIRPATKWRSSAGDRGLIEDSRSTEILTSALK